MQALSTTRYAGLYELIKNSYTANSAIQVSVLRENAPSDNLRQMIDILQLEGEKDFSDYTGADAGKEAKKIIEYIGEEWMKSERTRLQNEIAIAERSGDPELVKRLFAEFQQISRQQ